MTDRSQRRKGEVKKKRQVNSFFGKTMGGPKLETTPSRKGWLGEVTRGLRVSRSGRLLSWANTVFGTGCLWRTAAAFFG